MAKRKTKPKTYGTGALAVKLGVRRQTVCDYQESGVIKGTKRQLPGGAWGWEFTEADLKAAKEYQASKTGGKPGRPRKPELPPCTRCDGSGNEPEKKGAKS